MKGRAGQRRAQSRACRSGRAARARYSTRDSLLAVWSSRIMAAGRGKEHLDRPSATCRDPPPPPHTLKDNIGLIVKGTGFGKI